MQDYLLYFFPSSCFQPGDEDSQPNPAYAIHPRHCQRQLLPNWWTYTVVGKHLISRNKKGLGAKKGSFLGSDAKIRKWTLQGSSRKKKGEAATQRSWGREEHKNSTKPISLDARKQDEREGVYLCLDFKYWRGQKKTQWRETDDLVHVEKKEDERTVN